MFIEFLAQNRKPVEFLLTPECWSNFHSKTNVGRIFIQNRMLVVFHSQLNVRQIYIPNWTDVKLSA